MMATEEKTPETSAESPTELDGNLNNQCSLDGCIEDDAQSESTCQICEETLTNPKVLSCLHTFCQACLEKIVEEESAPIDGEPTKPVDAVKCPVKSCHEMTPLPCGKVDTLCNDLLAELELKPASENTAIICTSCKAKEKAIARCRKCPNFLCSHCTAAHKFMRCFEDHVVELFEDILSSGGTITYQKPVECRKHAEENLINFCNPCQEAVCQKCVALEHSQPDHQCVPLAEVAESNAEEMQALMSEGRKKLETSREVSQAMETSLSELQEQTDNARGLINETFQSYKSALEKLKDSFLAELDERHHQMELVRMEAFHEHGTMETKLEDACKFAERLLKNKDHPVYVSLYKKMVQTQMLKLMKNSMKTGVSGTIEFKTDTTAFESAIKKTFGWFVKDEPKVAPLVHSSFENKAAFNPMTAAPNMLAARQLVGHVATDAEFLTASLPTLNNVSQLAALSSTFDSLSTIANVGNLNTTPAMASLDPVSRTSLSPAMSDSGISVDAASTNSNNSATMMNIAAMAKMTSVGLSGQAIIGSSLTEVSGSGATVVSVGSTSTSRTQTPMGQGVDSMHGILAVSPTQQVQTPAENLEQLASLLNNQPPPPSLPFNTINTITPLDVPPVSGSSSEIVNTGLGSPTGSTYSSSTLVSRGLGSPTGSTFSTSTLVNTGTFNSTTTTTAPYPPVRRATKMSAMQIRCKFGQLGPGKCQFNSPHGFCLGNEQDIIVADTNNHRIQVFEKTGEFRAQFGIPGREEGQLWYPRKVAVMRPSGKYVVCDRGNERSRMQIFTRNGHFVKKIAIRYIDIVAGLAITASGHIVAVDSVSPTVFVISEAGELVKWFDCSDYMREPSDIAVSNKEYFVCDFKGHCVVVFNEDGGFLRRIGCENITNYPNGIDISDAGDVLIGDSHGNRFHVAVFQRDGSLIGEFQCPYVKVSRCCGLKITSEGYIVTLAKNNHHVLVLNTLYIV